MMQEIASKDGNFCGVCPVIGRLNKLSKRLRISLRVKEGSASVGHFSWLGVIRTAARTKKFRPYPEIKQTEYENLGGNKPWQTR